jgi:hypothetical protein
MAKKTRCWKGYRPVKGKAPYSPGSCEKVSEVYSMLVAPLVEGEAWTKKEGQNPEGGLNAKGRASLKAKGQNIKAPVTSKNPKGKAKARKKSFCARMSGMRKRQKKSNNTGKDRLSLSLKKWNC